MLIPTLPLTGLGSKRQRRNGEETFSNKNILPKRWVDYPILRSRTTLSTGRLYPWNKHPHTHIFVHLLKITCHSICKDERRRCVHGIPHLHSEKLQIIFCHMCLQKGHVTEAFHARLPERKAWIIIQCLVSNYQVTLVTWSTVEPT